MRTVELDYLRRNYYCSIIKKKEKNLSALHTLTTLELILVHSYADSWPTYLIATRKTWNSTLKIPDCCPSSIHGSHVTAKYK